MGDAAHTAHFSIGSGTKLALEDSIELARCIGNVPAACPTRCRPRCEDYEAVRSIEVLKIQNAARNSTEWFENVDRYVNLPPEQFAYSLLTRSQRISHENLRLRDKLLRRGVRGLDRRARRRAVAARCSVRSRRCSRRSRCAA